MIGVKNVDKTIRLTRFFKETHKVILNTPSALTMGGRFKNATTVTACAFMAILLTGVHDVFCAIYYKERRKPSKRQPLQRKVNSSSDGTSTR